MEEGLADFEAIAGCGRSPRPSPIRSRRWNRQGRLLDRVCSVFFNLNSSHTNEELEAIARDYSPKLAQYNAKISLNPALFARVVATSTSARDELGLETDQMRLLERSYLGFVRSGAALGEDAKARMAAISERMATLTHAVRPACPGGRDSPGSLCSEKPISTACPTTPASAAAAAAASERGLDGPLRRSRWLRASVEPFLTFSARRELRPHRLRRLGRHAAPMPEPPRQPRR